MALASKWNGFSFGMNSNKAFLPLETTSWRILLSKNAHSDMLSS